jgi:peroxiredoxin
MKRFAPLIIACVLALAAAGATLYALSSGDAAPDRESQREAPRAAPAPPATTSSSPPVGRDRRTVTLDDAIRELDLIRPSRQKQAEDFSLATADGKAFRLSEHRGKTVLINFWATWCPPCREEMPALERLYKKHKDRGLVLVAVSIDGNPKAVPPYVRASKLTFPIVLDPSAEVANKYGVRALPSSFVVDRQGAMTALALGPREWDNAASHALVEALAR